MTAASRRSVMTLFSGPTCADSHRIRFMLAEKGITPEIVEVTAAKQSEDLHDLNPYGTLPTLVDRDVALYSASVITEYLDERFPHPPLMPVDPVSRAKARLVLYRIEQDWYRPMRELESSGAGAAAARKLLADSLTSAADLFAEDAFFLGGDMTVMDCAVAPLLWRLLHYKIRLPEQASAVFAYSERIFGRESFQRSLSDAERAMRP
ncbi:MAG TPA: glutathione S-transferase N-terminal domain-containing protein [Gammaproteobacteria bacterium]|nr:glutathione S-transferase N-terminal domain-containing protein [Gammaproteobacteria bacterium]